MKSSKDMEKVFGGNVRIFLAKLPIENERKGKGGKDFGFWS
jgi:hypothetical protein